MSNENLHDIAFDQVFSELRSGCAQQDYEKAHHCIRWCLLYSTMEQIESILHYAINTVHVDMSTSYKWPWWLEYTRKTWKASLTSNKKGYFRIHGPSIEVMMR